MHRVYTTFITTEKNLWPNLKFLTYFIPFTCKMFKTLCPIRNLFQFSIDDSQWEQWQLKGKDAGILCHSVLLSPGTEEMAKL